MPLSKKLLKSAAVVSSMTMISRLLGFARDMVFARIFGADAATDAFFLAFKIPNFLRRLFAEGAFSQSFVPVFTDYKENRGEIELKLLIDNVAGTFGTVLFTVSLAGVIAAPLLIMAFGPGFIGDPGKYELAVDMLRITFPYLFFISLVAFSGGILNSYNQFAAPAFTPVFLNVVFISMAFWATPLFDKPVMALAWAVFIAGCVQLMFQFPFLHKLKMLPRPRWDWHHPGVQRIRNLMLPAIFGSSVVQINLLFDTLIASFLVTGSISWLYYSDRLVEFPLGLLGIALGTVILPKLSKDHATESPEKFSHTMDWALRSAFVVGLPSAVGLICLAAPMLATLFHSGHFSTDDVIMSSYSLIAFSFGLMGFILVKVLAPGFYARQDTKTPVKIGIKAMITNMFLNVLFVVPLVKSGFHGAHTGLALATSMSSYLNAFLLFHTLRKQQLFRPDKGWLKLLFQIGFACTFMAISILYFRPELASWLSMRTTEKVLTLLMLVVLGFCVYLLSMLATGFKLKSLYRLND